MLLVFVLAVLLQTLEWNRNLLAFLLQQSQNALALYLKRASPEFPRASNLSPRRKSPSSREIASFPGTLWGEETLFIIQHNIRWLYFTTEVRLELAIVIFSKEVFLI